MNEGDGKQPAALQESQHLMEPTIQVTINGQPKRIETPITVDRLLHKMHVGPRGVAVEVNATVLARPAQSSYVLQDGDLIEIVSLTGGG